METLLLVLNSNQVLITIPWPASWWCHRMGRSHLPMCLGSLAQPHVEQFMSWQLQSSSLWSYAPRSFSTIWATVVPADNSQVVDTNRGSSRVEKITIPYLPLSCARCYFEFGYSKKAQLFQFGTPAGISEQNRDLAGTFCCIVAGIGLQLRRGSSWINNFAIHDFGF